MNGIRAVGFDLFNTLITVESHALDRAVNRLSKSLREEGITVEPEIFRSVHRQAAIQHIGKTRHDGRETHKQKQKIAMPACEEPVLDLRNVREGMLLCSVLLFPHPFSRQLAGIGANGQGISRNQLLALP